MRLNGTVKFFNSTRGFGFISPENGEKDVFVHASALESSGVPALREGHKVSFEIEDDRRGRGKQAANIALSQSRKRDPRMRSSRTPFQGHCREPH